MELDSGVVLNILFLFLMLDTLLMLFLFISKIVYRRGFKKRSLLFDRLLKNILQSSRPEDFAALAKGAKNRFLSIINSLYGTVRIPKNMRQSIVEALSKLKCEKKLLRRLSSWSLYSRLQAVAGLAVIGTDEAVPYLVKRLYKEKRWFVKLSIVNTLTELEAEESITDIVATLGSGPEWYKKRVYSLLSGFGEELESIIIERIQSGSEREIECIIDFASEFTSYSLFQYVKEWALHASPEKARLARRAVSSLLKRYPEELIDPFFLTHSDVVIRKQAVKALSARPVMDSLFSAINALSDEETLPQGVAALSEIVRKRPDLMEMVEERYVKESDPGIQAGLAAVLSAFLDYYLINIQSGRFDFVKKLLSNLFKLKKVSDLIGFLNDNRSKAIEDSLLGIIKELLPRHPEISLEFALYLRGDLKEELGIMDIPEEQNKKKINITKFDWTLLFILFLGSIMVVPGLYFLMYILRGGAENLTLWSHVVRVTTRYHYFFAFYSILINSIYLVLLLLAGINLTRQIRAWRLKSLPFLFKKGILPSISILVPAYNEEKSVLESVRSLLTLKYPDFEVILVNDGSKDGTIAALIEGFSLEKVDKGVTGDIPSAPIKGVYRTPGIPHLTVIDKQNGGKADSLNSAINVAEKDYICTIDADSLLEPESLLRVMYQGLFTDKDPIALGGNIMPVNGCTVRNGSLTSIRLGHNHLARFQTVEYLRAFLAGRLGWSFTGCMLIISGAFGLFKRNLVKSVGGYMTGRGRYRKDTVGEDMELVVRLHKTRQRRGGPYAVPYAFNANCWTEVPEKWRVFSRQRDRWHRGLIEILAHHKSMLFNPAYGRIGLVAMPYFFLFELIGPVFELLGYVALAVSIIFGFLNPQIALLLFVSVVLYGILVSMGSLIISENEVLYFSFPETLIMIFYAIIENFGFRQLVSMMRVFSFASFFFTKREWGKMERAGFSAAKQSGS